MIIRTALAIIAGIVIGSIVNMGLIMAGSAVIPAPAGVDPMDAESIARNIDLFEAKHYVFPFLAHALGTLVGAIVGGYIGIKRRTAVVWVVAIVFLAGGIANTFMIPAPVTFVVADLLLAYIPMGLLALWVLNSVASENV